MILSQIILNKRKEIETLKGKPEIHEVGLPQRDFPAAISRTHQLNLIAEIKRSSPTKGLLLSEFEPAKLATIYHANGAQALSILTDEKFFGGHIDHIKKVKEAVPLPVLRKDFIIDEAQIYESEHAGADAILLIADILTTEQIRHFLSLAGELGLSAVLEVHSDEDVQKARETDARIIGINNRDLHTFKVDLNTTSRLIRQLPPERIVISESGIKSYEDVMLLRSLGVNAVLIGEALLTAPDIGAMMRKMRGVGG